MASPFVVPGDIIAEKYDVLRVLGVGGMGIVVAARHVELHHEVAIKFLRPELTSNREVIERFLREARAAVALKSEHVARVLDVGEMVTSGGDKKDGTGTAPFMVMEMLAGQDLSEVLRRRGPVPAGVAVRYVIQACDALREAHSLGIIHRDIKPSNLFLAKRGRAEIVKVLDFGIAKDARPDHSLTSTAAMIGSPLYMSPEQHTSAKHVDGRTDIWALGATLYELVMGIPPFNADSLAELTAKIKDADAVSIRSRRPEVPEGLDDVVKRCLAKDPAARFRNIDELVAALEPFATPEPSAPTVASFATTPSPSSASTPAPSVNPSPATTQPTTTPTSLLLLGVGVVVAGAAGWGIWQGTHRATTSVGIVSPVAPATTVDASSTADASVLILPELASSPPPPASRTPPPKIVPATPAAQKPLPVAASVSVPTASPSSAPTIFKPPLIE